MKSNIYSQAEKTIVVDIMFPNVHTINTSVQPVHCITTKVQEPESHVMYAENTQCITASLCQTTIELN